MKQVKIKVNDKEVILNEKQTEIYNTISKFSKKINEFKEELKQLELIKQSLGKTLRSELKIGDNDKITIL